MALMILQKQAASALRLPQGLSLQTRRPGRQLLCCAPVCASSPRGQSLDRPRSRVLPLLAELAYQQAVMARFEKVVGRTAMLGIGVAVALELLVVPTTGLFGGVTGGQVAISGATIVLSMALATATKRRRGGPLLEPLLASLTSQFRSQASVTQSNVDRAIDVLMDTVFSSQFMLQAFPLEDLDSIVAD